MRERATSPPGREREKNHISSIHRLSAASLAGRGERKTYEHGAVLMKYEMVVGSTGKTLGLSKLQAMTLVNIQMDRIFLDSYFTNRTFNTVVNILQNEFDPHFWFSSAPKQKENLLVYKPHLP